MKIGRQEIFTDVKEVTSENVIDILRNSIEQHEQNAGRMKFLLNYEKGHQPIKRTKKYRADINCQCIDNVANEVTEFKLGFNWGNPITLVQRDNLENSNQDISNAVTMLNRYYESQNIKAKTQQLGRFVEICGVGYTYVDINTDWQEGDSPFTIDVLDPRCTFIVKSSYYIDHRPMLAVTYYCDNQGNKTYTCFTKDSRYEISNLFEHKDRSNEINPLNAIPIVEWIRSYDRMGCFERQISEMDNLNLLVSDYTNDIEQNTQVIWLTTDIEFPKDEEGNEKKPKTNDWLQVYTSKDGKTPSVKPLTVDYDYKGMLENIVSRRALILQKCNVPSRNDNSGGSTGIAMSDATGWTQAEVDATRQDQIKDACKLKEVKLVLKAIAKSPDVEVDNPLNQLKYTDIKASIKRQKTYEMTTKINAYATGVSHGIWYEDMLNAINLFEDPQQVAKNSKETTEKYLESIFLKQNEAVGGEGEKSPNADRLDQDKSDQETNSPNMTGQTTQ